MAYTFELRIRKSDETAWASIIYNASAVSAPYDSGLRSPVESPHTWHCYYQVLGIPSGKYVRITHYDLNSNVKDQIVLLSNADVPPGYATSISTPQNITNLATDKYRVEVSSTQLYLTTSRLRITSSDSRLTSDQTLPYDSGFVSNSQNKTIIFNTNNSEYKTIQILENANIIESGTAPFSKTFFLSVGQDKQYTIQTAFSGHVDNILVYGNKLSLLNDKIITKFHQ